MNEKVHDDFFLQQQEEKCRWLLILLWLEARSFLLMIMEMEWLCESESVEEHQHHSTHSEQYTRFTERNCVTCLIIFSISALLES